MNIKSANNTCLISCFLPLTKENISLWEKTNALLKNHNIDLILITAGEVKDNFEFPTINVPTFLHQFNEKFEFDSYTNENLDEEDLLLIERDMFWSNVDITKYANHYLGFLKCREFYNQLINFISPSIAFLWGNYLAQSEIFKKLLDDYQIPNFYLERGFFTGSIMIENLLNEKLKDNINCKEKYSNQDLYNEIKNFYINTNQTKYPIEQDHKIEESILKLKEHKKIISFFPNPDHSLFPREHNLSKEISPIFHSHIEMANELAKCVEQSEDLYLIIKTHPLDNISKFKHLESSNVLVNDKIYFRNLFKNSDLLIFTTTTLQYEALFFDKPILLLANSALKYSNIPYTIKSKEELNDTIRNILMEKKNVDKENLKKNFVYKILEDYTYFYNIEFPSCKKIEDFCGFIVKNVKPEKSGSGSVINKLISFQGFVNLRRCKNDSNPIITINHSSQLRFYNERYKTKIENYFKDIDNFIESKIEIGDLFDVEFIISSLNGTSPYVDKNGIINKLLNKRNLLVDKNNWTAKNSAAFLLESEKLIEKNNIDLAEEKIKKILDIEPHHIEALNDYGVIQVLKHNLLYAKKIFEWILKLDPYNQLAKENLTYIDQNYTEAEKEDEALLNYKYVNTKKISDNNSIKNNNYRSLKFINREHRRYLWYKLEHNNFVPICYLFLSDEEWEIIESWFDESEKVSLIEEAQVPFISFLQGIIMGNKIDRIVQLGTYAGFSSLLIGFMLRKMNIKNGFISFDIDSQSTEFAQKYVNLAGLNEYVRLELSDSTKNKTANIAISHFNGKLPKMVIIDSSHQKDQTIEELNLWYKHLLNGGLMIFHDSSDFAKQWDSTQKGGVKAALDEWLNNNSQIKFINIYNSPESLNNENYVYQDINGIAIIQK